MNPAQRMAIRKWLLHGRHFYLFDWLEYREELTPLLAGLSESARWRAKAALNTDCGRLRGRHALDRLELQRNLHDRRALLAMTEATVDQLCELVQQTLAVVRLGAQDGD